jgi:hypothetical protein
MAKIKGRVAGSVKRKPKKAGSTMPRNVGGYVNAKVVAIVKKRKNG